ncbi:translation initiation factor IF-2-like [Orcinus orca]|uniref:translation initiation factor IF-2-like n=1 Tax=Orcinus orca TaxID=9733 RepID=UPI0021113118|nr:translation initiation factor IF-2-like [Orcinus orca]
MAIIASTMLNRGGEGGRGRWLNSRGAVTEPHLAQEKRPAGVLGSPAGRGGARFWKLQPRRQGDSERKERSVAAGEGGAAQKSRRRQPGSFCGPGARTREARGCGATRAAGPPSCGAAATGCRRWRNRGWGARPVQAPPAAPARHPEDSPGAGTAPRPGAWRRSPRASLPRCGGPPSRAGAGSPAALSGDVWERWRGRRGFPACHTLAWGKDWDGQSLVGAPRGSENCTRSRAPETGSGDPRGPSVTW